MFFPHLQNNFNKHIKFKIRTHFELIVVYLSFHIHWTYLKKKTAVK